MSASQLKAAKQAGYEQGFKAGLQAAQKALAAVRPKGAKQTTQVAVTKSKSSKRAVPKRGPGRPRKTKMVKQGRVKKTTTTGRRGPGRPPKLPAVKRGRGRPKKVA